MSKRSDKIFADIDAMSPVLRECVHEFGYAIVKACVSVGVTKPQTIRNLVREIWAGARQPGQRKIGRQVTPVENTLDWLLIQSGADMSAAAFVRLLYDNSMVIVPVEPSQAMVTASMDAVKFMDRVTKEQKHRNRLRDAVRACTKSLWPHLLQPTVNESVAAVRLKYAGLQPAPLPSQDARS